MKKSIYLTIFLLLAVVLNGCEKKDTNIVISKLITDQRQVNNIIELYNNSNNNVDLSGYKLKIYTNGSNESSNVIELEGVINSNSYYVISGNNFNIEQYSNLIDYIHNDNLAYNGNDAIELIYKNKVVDVVGYVGFNINFSKNTTLIKLGNEEDYSGNQSFNQYNYISYASELYKYIKNDNHEIKTLEHLYAGPRLEEKYLLSNYQENDIGLGGVVSTSHIKGTNADGDTAHFEAKDGYLGGSNRYYYIDTPEVDGTHVKAQAWGYVASKFNKEYILTADTIQLQSIPGISTTETYGRNLSLVWADGNLAQFMIVAEGLSDKVPPTLTDTDLELTYKDVPYLTYIQFAQERAIINGWGIFGYPNNPEGEKSPDWNYSANKNSTTNPVWNPNNEWGISND